MYLGRRTGSSRILPIEPAARRPITTSRPPNILVPTSALILILCCAWCGSRVEAASPPPDQAWYSQTYRLENGLRVGSILAIAQDGVRFLWLGTNAGLVHG